MLIFGHGLPSGIVLGRRVDSSVHGQPLFSAGALGSSANDGHRMIEPFFSSPVPASKIAFAASGTELCGLTGASHARFSPIRVRRNTVARDAHKRGSMWTLL